VITWLRRSRGHASLYAKCQQGLRPGGVLGHTSGPSPHVADTYADIRSDFELPHRSPL